MLGVDGQDDNLDGALVGDCAATAKELAEKTQFRLTIKYIHFASNFSYLSVVPDEDHVSQLLPGLVLESVLVAVLVGDPVRALLQRVGLVHQLKDQAQVPPGSLGDVRWIVDVAVCIPTQKKKIGREKAGQNWRIGIAHFFSDLEDALSAVIFLAAENKHSNCCSLEILQGYAEVPTTGHTGVDKERPR